MLLHLVFIQKADCPGGIFFFQLKKKKKWFFFLVVLLPVKITAMAGFRPEGGRKCLFPFLKWLLGTHFAMWSPRYCFYWFPSITEKNSRWSGWRLRDWQRETFTWVSVSHSIQLWWKRGITSKNYLFPGDECFSASQKSWSLSAKIESGLINQKRQMNFTRKCWDRKFLAAAASLPVWKSANLLWTPSCSKSIREKAIKIK